ncbi:secreted/surface protein with fasciclin-like repeat [Actinobacteria bacterium IMCC26207]|nr:secreted/surface protein with fasciclin-like repeat [Actinobacteria bacterium IMCC26207]
MRNKFMIGSLALVMGFGLVAGACSSDSESESTTTEAGSTETTMADDMAGDENIVEIAVGNPDFTTLVELVTAAGLAETLSGDGPFTVFAPVNAAFAEVPADTLTALAADPTGALTDVLKLHVIAGEVDSAAATAAVGTCVETLGGKVLIGQEGDNLTFGGATITDVDITGSNGIIHVIDGVVTEASADCPT